MYPSLFYINAYEEAPRRGHRISMRRLTSFYLHIALNITLHQSISLKRVVKNQKAFCYKHNKRKVVLAGN